MRRENEEARIESCWDRGGRRKGDEIDREGVKEVCRFFV